MEMPSTSPVMDPATWAITASVCLETVENRAERYSRDRATLTSSPGRNTSSRKARLKRLRRLATAPSIAGAQPASKGAGGGPRPGRARERSGASSEMLKNMQFVLDKP